MKYFIVKFYNRARGEVMVCKVKVSSVEKARETMRKYYFIPDNDILDIIIKDE